MRLAGIWMVSRATVEGVKTRSRVKSFLGSINNVKESTLCLKIFCNG